MVLRQLAYLVALAREKHFGRAAEACRVTQPTLSAAIQQLEQELGAPLIERSQRFVGLTPQGELALEHAHRILAEAEGLRARIEEMDKGLSGQLRLGVIPTALPIVSHLTGAILRALSARHCRRAFDDFPGDPAAASRITSSKPASPISTTSRWSMCAHSRSTTRNICS